MPEPQRYQLSLPAPVPEWGIDASGKEPGPAIGRRLPFAVAGFRADEIEVVAQQNQLTIAGKRAGEKDRGEYLHRGIAARPFERRFRLADFIKVRSANSENGLLTIGLQRVVPEAMEPRKIATAGGATVPGRPDAPAGEVAHAA